VPGYWSSWYAEARDSSELKRFLGLGEEDKCLGVFILGRCADVSGYRGKRSPAAEKVTWRV
jgi:hypothetical protein